MKKKIIISTLLISATIAFAQNESSSMFENPSIKFEVDDNVPTSVKSYSVSTTAAKTGPDQIKWQTLQFEQDRSEAVDGTIRLDPNARKQPVDGFGFAITGSAAYNLSKMKADRRHEFLTRIFSPTDGYGCNFVRVPIGCSDFSLSEYTCWDDKSKGFALTSEETNYIIPIMKEILSINPSVKVLSSPWTAPRWMKTNGQWTSGELKPECYGDYADYFVKWIKAMGDNGIKIYAVTQQNEPLNRGNSASMFMGWEQARDFAKVMGPRFKNAGLETKIFVFDHNYNYDNMADQQHYPSLIYKDEEAAKYIAGAAYHNYGGNPSEMSYVHDMNPEKELVFTEWTAGTWTTHGIDVTGILTDAQALVFDVLNNHGRGAIVWNLMLDSERGPNRPGGCVTGNGAVDINKGGYDNITHNSFYYVMCIAAAAASDNATLIGTDGSANDVQCVAFENTDGFGAVLMNTSNQARKVRLQQADHSFIATLPAKSIASYRW